MRIFKWRLFEKLPPPPSPPPRLLDDMHDVFAGLGLLITTITFAWLVYLIATRVVPAVADSLMASLRGLTDKAAAGPPELSEQNLKLASQAVRTSRIAIAPGIGEEAAYATLCRALSAQGYRVELWLLGEAESEAEGGGGGPLRGVSVKTIEAPIGPKAFASDAEMSAAMADGSAARYSSALVRRFTTHAPSVCSQFYALADSFQPDVLVCHPLLAALAVDLRDACGVALIQCCLYPHAPSADLPALTDMPLRSTFVPALSTDKQVSSPRGRALSTATSAATTLAAATSMHRAHVSQVTTTQGRKSSWPLPPRARSRPRVAVALLQLALCVLHVPLPPCGRCPLRSLPPKVAALTRPLFELAVCRKLFHGALSVDHQGARQSAGLRALTADAYCAAAFSSDAQPSLCSWSSVLLPRPPDWKSQAGTHVTGFMVSKGDVAAAGVGSADGATADADAFTPS